MRSVNRFPFTHLSRSYRRSIGAWNIGVTLFGLSSRSVCAVFALEIVVKTNMQFRLCLSDGAVFPDDVSIVQKWKHKRCLYRSKSSLSSVYFRCYKQLINMSACVTWKVTDVFVLLAVVLESGSWMFVMRLFFESSICLVYVGRT